MNHDDVLYTAIEQEILAAEAKRPLALRHELPGWMAIMRAELAEAEEAWIKGDGLPANDAALHEILQVVATGIRALRQYGGLDR